MSDWLFLVLAAPFVGSFLGVLATRFFSKRSIIFGRSKCPSCNHRLAPRDLVPIASWIFHRRRCQYCSAPIAFFYPLMEIGALLVAVSAVSLFSGWLIWVSCAFGWVLLVIAAIDYQHMILPDELYAPSYSRGPWYSLYLEFDMIS